MKTNALATMIAALSISVSFIGTAPVNAQDNPIVPKGGTTHDSKQPAQPDSGTSNGGTTTGTKSGAGSSGDQPSGQSAPNSQGSMSNDTQNGSSTNNGSTDQSGTRKQRDNVTKSQKGTESGSTNNTTAPKSNDTNQSGENQNGANTKGGTTGNSVNTTKSTEKPASGTEQGTTSSETTTTGKQSNTQVQVSVEQQTQIRQAIKEVHVAPIRETDFTVSVGTRIPRKIELQPLPPTIVKIVPQYKTYRFFVLADGRIVIVDPSTFEIVYIIDA